VLGSFFARGSRGTRTDAVVIYDARTLSPIDEVILPKGRFLVADKGHNVDLGSDGRYLLSTNMTPATSVSVVDLEERRYLGEIETPGCTLVYPSGPRRFSSLCADGALFSASFDEKGRAEASRTKPFFDVLRDPVFEHAGTDRARHQFHFITYAGTIHSVDLSGEVPAFAEPWSILDEQDAAASWRPGGWDPIAFQAATRRLYVLMHQGGEWTHKKDGEEVWVFDLDARKRVARIALSKPSKTIAVTQGDDPAQLYAMAGSELMIYDATSGDLQGSLESMGKTPLEIVVHNR
jgi:methylamine dehydrogenase heavy chain